ncbi:hypothetical protein RND81_13G023800 [Saponaria officinalis]|uniref:TTF-type domain-containing protein n=1 Tax=Saponaria officinalis TaxID=3572 RepID=A0AAW1GYN7_SAPOF
MHITTTVSGGPTVGVDDGINEPTFTEAQEVDQGDNEPTFAPSQGVGQGDSGPFIFPPEDEDDALLPRDPGKRKVISSYPFNDQDCIRREYIDKKPCRPIPIGKAKFSSTLIGKKMRRFGVHWYNEFDWLEYNVQNDVAFCFYCFLFKVVAKSPTGDAFVNGRWNNWNKPERLRIHVADESSDVSHKEELAICLRYVNKKGKICERFLVVVHVGNTTSRTLMEAIKFLLDDHLLLMSNIRCQGYDGASNMRGFVVIVIGLSCKRLEMVRVVQAQKVLQALELGEIESGQGLNQELGLSRPGDNRWGSHFKSIVNLIALYSTIIEVLVNVGEDAKSKEDRVKAQNAIDHLESFEFAFMLHLMQIIFGYTNELCEALQRRDLDIVNAMTLVSLTKGRLQKNRDHG